MISKKAADGGEILISEMPVKTITVCILGTRPLIHNRLAKKAQEELLYPKGRKSTSEKAISVKHNPIEEFRNSVHRMLEKDAPTELGAPAVWFKKSMAQAALDIPGATKSQISRLIFVKGDSYRPVYGIPHLFMAVTRSSDMKRTPDIRTRAILPEWCTEVDIEFPNLKLSEKSIVNLLSAAGTFCGVGDWRQEKGSNNYGSFKLCQANDPEYLRIKKMGRAQQIAALESAPRYGEDTDELMSWFENETKARGLKLAA